MTIYQIIYQITLPKKQNIEKFIAFMQEKYFPAVRREPTRKGVVTSLVLLQGKDTNTVHRLFWHVGWDGVPEGGPVIVNSQDVQNAFEAFNVNLKCLGIYGEVAVLPDKKLPEK